MTMTTTPEFSEITFRPGKHILISGVILVLSIVVALLMIGYLWQFDRTVKPEDRSFFGIMFCAGVAVIPLGCWGLWRSSREFLTVKSDRVVWDNKYLHREIFWKDVTSVSCRNRPQQRGLKISRSLRVTYEPVAPQPMRLVLLGSFGEWDLSLNPFSDVCRRGIVAQIRAHLRPEIPFVDQQPQPLVIPPRRLAKGLILGSLLSYAWPLVWQIFPDTYLLRLLGIPLIIFVPSAVCLGLLDAFRCRSWRLLALSLLLLASIPLWWFYILKPLISRSSP